MKRCFNEAEAETSPIGYLPYPQDINLEGSGVDENILTDLLSVDANLWTAEIKGIREFYAKFGDKLPPALARELDELESRLK